MSDEPEIKRIDLPVEETAVSIQAFVEFLRKRLVSVTDDAVCQRSHKDLQDVLLLVEEGSLRIAKSIALRIQEEIDIALAGKSFIADEEEVSLIESFEPLITSPHFQLQPGDHLVIRNDEHQEILLLEEELGHGVIVRTFLGERIMDQRRQKVAIRVIKNETYLQFAKREVEVLHTLRQAIKDEPVENFPGKRRINYFPKPLSGLKLAALGITVVEYYKTESVMEYAKTLSLKDRYHLVYQILHAFLIAEKAGVVNSDIKPDRAGAYDFRVMPDGSVKVLDWNVTYPASHPLAERKKTSVVYKLIDIINAILAAEDITSEAFFKFYGKGMDTNYDLVEQIRLPQKWTFGIAMLVIESMLTGKRKTVSALYNLILADPDRNVLSLGVEAMQYLEELVEKFNDSFPERKEAREKARSS